MNRIKALVYGIPLLLISIVLFIPGYAAFVIAKAINNIMKQWKINYEFRTWHFLVPAGICFSDCEHYIRIGLDEEIKETCRPL